MIRSFIACLLALGLLVPLAGAKQKKPSQADAHPKPAQHVKNLRSEKVKPHKAG